MKRFNMGRKNQNGLKLEGEGGNKVDRLNMRRKGEDTMKLEGGIEG